MRGWRKVYNGGRSWVAQEGESVIAPSLWKGLERAKRYSG